MTDATTAVPSPSLPATAPPLLEARAWQRRPSTQILSALGLVLPMAAIAYWVYRSQADGVTLELMFLGPLIGGGALLFWILFLHRFVCGDGLDRLGFFLDRPGLDVALGTGAAAALLAFQFVYQAVAGGWFPPHPPAPGILKLLAGVARDPWLLALWLGPVAWIGVALFEESARAFLLRRMWRAWPGTTGRWTAIVFVASLIGGVHIYQGSAAALSIAIQSIGLGWLFLMTGRIRALIVAHALYDSAQIVFAVVAIRAMGL